METGIPFRLIAFIVASAGIVFVSRKSLRAPRSHGFYRFFAWELMLVSFFLVVDRWFADESWWAQIVSSVLLIASLVPLTLGVRALVERGKPAPRREGEPQLLSFEKTTTLVTTGVYRYVRHPLYCSLLLVTWGIFFKAPSVLAGSLALATTVFLVATAKADEAECIRYFGPAYEELMRRTRMFLPFVF
jgi:protein-S-isoprenylcysteine O-methyltransferase Ste14